MHKNIHTINIHTPHIYTHTNPVAIGVKELEHCLELLPLGIDGVQHGSVITGLTYEACAYIVYIG